MSTDARPCCRPASTHDWQPLVPLLPREHPRYLDHRMGRVLAQLQTFETCLRCGRLRNRGGLYNYPEIEAGIRERAVSFAAGYHDVMAEMDAAAQRVAEELER